MIHKSNTQSESEVNKDSPSSRSFNINHPHDHMFKVTLGNRDRAIAFIKHFFEPHLLNALNIDELQTSPDSFIDAEFKDHFADLLYHVPLKADPLDEHINHAFVYILLEHKSALDQWLPFQLLRYMVNIWAKHRSDYPNDTKLPFIIPILFYHGQPPWPSHYTLANRIHTPTDLTKQLSGKTLGVQLDYLVYDLTQIKESVFPQNLQLEIQLYVMKHIHSTHLLDQEFIEAIQKAKSLPEPDLHEALETIIRYILASTPHISKDSIINTLKKYLPLEVNFMKSAAHVLYDEAYEEGIEKGKQEGLNIGLIRAKRILLTSIELKFGIVGRRLLQQKVESIHTLEEIDSFEDLFNRAINLQELT